MEYVMFRLYCYYIIEYLGQFAALALLMVEDASNLLKLYN